MFRILTACVFVFASLAFLSSAFAEVSVGLSHHRSGIEKNPFSECSIGDVQLPENLIVFESGNGNSRPLDFQIDRSGDRAYQSDIIVNEPSGPVALVLTANDPTIWNISYTPKTKIAAIILGGYGSQVVSGLEESTPTIVRTFDQTSKESECADLYFDESLLRKFDQISYHFFGKPADGFFPVGLEGSVVIGKKDYQESEIIHSDDRSPESYRLPNTPLAGDAGIEEALKNGLIRRADESDVISWFDRLSDMNKSASVEDLEEYMSIALRLKKAYVILDHFTYPAGMHGADYAFFFLPEGIAKPEGNQGHSSTFDFNTMECTGSICER